MVVQKLWLVAYQLGEKINLNGFRVAYEGHGVICSSTANDLFIKKGANSYLYIQNSGEVAFSDCSESTINELLEIIYPFVGIPVAKGKEYKEEFLIEVDPDQQLSIDYNSIRLQNVNADVIKIALLNVSQSVALDYFTEISQDFLNQTTKFTIELEQRGKLRIPQKELMKFIGKTLNTQNRIIDNLYFIDAPDTVWENENLSQVNNSLSRIFNLKTRFREVEYTLKIIDNNLHTFSQLVQHQDNKIMELTVIFLILFEVVNALLSRVF